jgi:hypothetical protein
MQKKTILGNINTIKNLHKATGGLIKIYFGLTFFRHRQQVPFWRQFWWGLCLILQQPLLKLIIMIKITVIVI